MLDQKHLDLFDQYPFLTLLESGDTEFICVIQSHDDQFTTFYDFGSLKASDHKEKFLELCDQWWWESNRIIPINLFLKADWDCLKYTQKTVSTKSLNILAGNIPANLAEGKKSKRKSVTLVKKI